MDQAVLNVNYVADLSPYRTMKVRILNERTTAWLFRNDILQCFRTGFREAVEEFENGVIFEGRRFLRKHHSKYGLGRNELKGLCERCLASVLQNQFSSARLKIYWL